MPIIEAGASALGALKTAYDLIREVRNSDDTAKLKATIDELASRLVDARADVLAMQEEIAALRRRAEVAEAAIEKRVSFQEKANNFVRVQAGGATVYREKNPHSGQTGATAYCPTCFEDEKLSPFQPSIIPGVLRCNVCKGTAKTN